MNGPGFASLQAFACCFLTSRTGCSGHRPRCLPISTSSTHPAATRRPSAGPSGLATGTGPRARHRYFAPHRRPDARAGARARQPRCRCSPQRQCREPLNIGASKRDRTTAARGRHPRSRRWCETFQGTTNPPGAGDLATGHPDRWPFRRKAACYSWRPNQKPDPLVKIAAVGCWP